MSSEKAGVGGHNSLVAFSGDPRYGTDTGYRAATAVAGKFPIGKEKHHPEARYKVSWYESGKKRFEEES